MKRKEFIKSVAGAAIVTLPAVSLLSCSSSADPDPMDDEEGCLANGTSVTVGSNHGHSLTVSKDDVNAGVDKEYNIQGSSGHAHSVTVTAAHFASLKNNTEVQVTSTEGASHTHSITISCA